MAMTSANMANNGSQKLLSSSNVAVMILAACMWVAAFLLPVPVPEEPLRVAVPLWPGAESLVLDRAAGRVQPEEISLIEINWTSASMRAVGNRVVDAAILTLDEALLQIQQGYPLKILLVTDISRGADAVLVSPDIPSIREIRGRKVGYEPRTSGSRLLELAMKEADLPLDSISQVVLNAIEIQDAQSGPPVDVIVCSEPWQQRLKRLGMKSVFDSSRPGAEVVRVLVAHADAIRQNKNALIKLVRAHFDWAPRLAELGDELEPVLRREGVTQEEFFNILKFIKTPSLEQNRRWLSFEDPWLAQTFDSLLVELALDPASPVTLRAEDVFDPAFLEVLP